METPVHERFMSHVKKSGLRPLTDVVKSDCWEWTGCLDRNGYGHFKIKRRTFRAHRVSYNMYVGEIPDGLELDHLCRNRHCVNPEHLEPVTSKVNTYRGVSFAAVNGKKEVCDNGHAFSEENTYIEKRTDDGTFARKCRLCLAAARHSFKTVVKQSKQNAKPRPSVAELKAHIDAKKTWREIGLEYGVTDNAVKKWAKKFGLQVPVRSYVRRTEVLTTST